MPMTTNMSQTINSMSAAYPATTKQAAGLVDGIPTDVTSILFADKIMVTISQGGRLAQWVRFHSSLRFALSLIYHQIHVPLGSSNPNFADQYLSGGADENALLPMAHLSPKTLLGGSTSERETIGQLYATQIASAITSKNPQENRTAVVGLGLNKLEANRQTFYDVIDLVMTCL